MKEYVPKEYQRKAMEQIKNRTHESHFAHNASKDGKSQGSTTELLETLDQSPGSVIVLSEKDAAKYVKEYVPKEYQRKAMEQIKNRTHVSHSAHTASKDGKSHGSTTELLETLDHSPGSVIVLS